MLAFNKHASFILFCQRFFCGDPCVFLNKLKKILHLLFPTIVVMSCFISFSFSFWGYFTLFCQDWFDGAVALPWTQLQLSPKPTDHSGMDLQVKKLLWLEGSHGCFRRKQFIVPYIYFDNTSPPFSALYNTEPMPCCLQENKKHKLRVFSML